MTVLRSLAVCVIFSWSIVSEGKLTGLLVGCSGPIWILVTCVLKMNEP